MSRKKDKKTVADVQQENDTLYSQEQIDKMTSDKIPQGQMLISGAGFWDFTSIPIFEGRPLGTHVEDPNDGRILGYDFVTEDGEQFVIGASHSITKALEMQIKDKQNNDILVLNSGRKLFIKWEGKIDLKEGGRSFNKYTIVLLDD